MEATHWTGDDPRDLQTPSKTPQDAFWEAYAFARRHGAVEELLAVHEALEAVAGDLAEARTLHCACGVWRERGQVVCRHLAPCRPAFTQDELTAFYAAAIEADIAYSKAVQAVGASSRWRMTKAQADAPAVVAAYHVKVCADSLWHTAMTEARR